MPPSANTSDVGIHLICLNIRAKKERRSHQIAEPTQFTFVDEARHNGKAFSSVSIRLLLGKLKISVSWVMKRVSCMAYFRFLTLNLMGIRANLLISEELASRLAGC